MSTIWTETDILDGFLFLFEFSKGWGGHFKIQTFQSIFFCTCLNLFWKGGWEVTWFQTFDKLFWFSLDIFLCDRGWGAEYSPNILRYILLWFSGRMTKIKFLFKNYSPHKISYTKGIQRHPQKGGGESRQFGNIQTNFLFICVFQMASLNKPINIYFYMGDEYIGI